MHILRAATTKSWLHASALQALLHTRLERRKVRKLFLKTLQSAPRPGYGEGDHYVMMKGDTAFCEFRAKFRASIMVSAMEEKRIAWRPHNPTIHLVVSPLAAAFLACALHGPLRINMVELLMQAIARSFMQSGRHIFNRSYLEADIARTTERMDSHDASLQRIGSLLNVPAVEVSALDVAAATATAETYPGQASARANLCRLEAQEQVLDSIEEVIADRLANLNIRSSDDEESHDSGQVEVEHYAQENLEDSDSEEELDLILC